MTRVTLLLTVFALQGPQFAPAPSSPVMVGPGSGVVVLADVSGDGHLDLITQHLLHGTVAVQLGDGKGHFAPAAASPIRLSFQPGPIAVGDVNNDRILDLAVANKDSHDETVAIFFGNGRGGFRPAPGSPFRTSASMKFYKPILRLVDVGEDGNLDIVTANGRRNTIEILLGDGRGRFSPRPIVTLESGRDFYSFGLGDVDADGHLDLVTSADPGQVVVRRGNGKGAFTDAAAPLRVPPDPRVATLADVNGDRHVDIVLTHGRSNFLSVLLNDGNGAFSSQPTTNVGMPAFAVVVADVNQDKKADLVAAAVNRVAPFESKVVVLLGDNHAFVPARGSPFRAGLGAYNLAVGDIDEDGKLDVAASSFEGNGVTVLLGR